MIRDNSATEIVGPDSDLIVYCVVPPGFLLGCLLFLKMCNDFLVKLLDRGPLVLVLVSAINFDFNSSWSVLRYDARTGLVLVLSARSSSTSVTERDISLVNSHATNSLLDHHNEDRIDQGIRQDSLPNNRLQKRHKSSSHTLHIQ